MDSYKEKSRGLEKIGREHWYFGEECLWDVNSLRDLEEHKYEVAGRFVSG